MLKPAAGPAVLHHCLAANLCAGSRTAVGVSALPDPRINFQKVALTLTRKNLAHEPVNFVVSGGANMLKRMGILVFAAVVGMLCLEAGEKMSIPGVSGVVSPAHAVIGRPGTPRSVAGVARRTYRRCATGVYRC